MKTLPKLNAFTVAFAAVVIALPAFAQQAKLSRAASDQMAQIISAKNSFSAGEKKLSSNLAFASRQAHGKAVAANLAANVAGKDGLVQIVVRGKMTDALQKEIASRGGTVDVVSALNDRLEARVPVGQLEALAEHADVGSIRQPARVRTNAGSVTSQAYVSHRAKPVVEGNPAVNGFGVKVGVLSDSASLAQVAALKASGDLAQNATVLAGESGEPGSDEGAAMMEIVQDLAPLAQVFFATAFTSEASFANNILKLRQAGCFVGVDDVSYSDEDPFQDGTIAQAVDAFVGTGGIYFSSAANSGNFTFGNSTCWEGDFVDGPPITSGPIFTNEGTAVTPNDFGGGTTNNQILQGTDVVDLFWADPLGGASDDYDLFVLNSTLTTIKGFSTTVQNGSQDAYEEVATPPFGNYSSPAAGDRIVVVRKAGSTRRAMHLETFGESTLAFSTPGSTHGHNAGQLTQSCAATYWGSAQQGLVPFNGTNNAVEAFSSDGPRKIFFNVDGSPITPGNYLFATNGGITLQKPDFSAADGVTTATPGFNPFFGTSASAPHAAGVAALLKSAKPSLGAGQIRQIMVNTAKDNMSPGADRDGGVGVIDAQAAVQAIP